jgi:hypothetical protein
VAREAAARARDAAVSPTDPSRPGTGRPQPLTGRPQPLTGSRQRSNEPREQGQDLADGAYPASGVGQRQVRLDLVAVAAPVLVLDHVAGLGQVGNDAVSGALGDAQPGRDVTRRRTPGS